MKTLKKLSVPLFFQPEYKPLCGPACSKMILAFHGYKATMNRINAEMKVDSDGADMASIGIFFLNRNFKVTIEAWMSDFPNRFIGLENGSKEELLPWCRRNGCRKKIQRFIELGGELLPRPVSVQRLRAAIKKHCPPILNLDISIIYKLPRQKYAGHYVIPVHITGKKMTVNDPSPDYGGITVYPIEHIMHACYIWNAGAIFITPQ